jgi:hypothetical protein
MTLEEIGQRDSVRQRVCGRVVWVVRLLERQADRDSENCVCVVACLLRISRVWRPLDRIFTDIALLGDACFLMTCLYPTGSYTGSVYSSLLWIVRKRGWSQVSSEGDTWKRSLSEHSLCTLKKTVEYQICCQRTLKRASCCRRWHWM